MFLQSFQITIGAMLQIILLGATGFFLVKKGILGGACLGTLSRLVISVTLPVLMFAQISSSFSFTNFSHWWIFPLLGAGLSLFGLALGKIFRVFVNGQQHKLQFSSLLGFQNSGYLPLVLVGALLGPDKAGTVLIYIFLFLLGFNILMFSLGVHMLVHSGERKFSLSSAFSPTVIATLAGLAVVLLGINRFIPALLFKPMVILGDCTFPLALLVVGGCLAQIKLYHVNKKAAVVLCFVKLIFMPALGILVVKAFGLPELLGFLIVMELAMPSATTLASIISQYNKEDLLISQGIFFTHIASIITIPLFLSLFFILK